MNVHTYSIILVNRCCYLKGQILMTFCEMFFYTLLVLPMSRSAYSKLVDSAAWESVGTFSAGGVLIQH